ncbi:amphi-Trp domain-containing protein [Roseovarius salinarum]|uniref:amphi-Trp domain-containing protein n=1 Tax=Roseovarius salinarum TaxID=1981892 RepID=UPI000C33F318|nr:amphi-Trp domain-containing protein [Roseovarius salinarum]
MGRETVLFSSKETRSRQEVGAFLRDLADRLDSGRVTLRRGEEEMALDLPGQMVLEIKVEDEEKRRRGTQHSLEVEMKWFDGTTPASSLELG